MEYLGEILATVTALSFSIGVVLFRIAGFSIKPIPLSLFKTIAAAVFFVFALVVVKILWPQSIGSFEWIPQMTTNEWIRITASGIFGVALGDLLFIYSLNRLGAGFMAIIEGFYSPMVIFFAFLVFGEVVPPLVFLGGFLVVSAIAVGSEGNLEVTSNKRDLVIGISVALVSLVFVVLSVIIIRDMLRAHSVLWLASFRYVVAGIFLFLMSLRMGGIKEALGIFRTPAFRVVLAGTFFGYYLSSFLWCMGFKYTLAGKAAIFNQLSTPFIFILGAIVLKESLNPRRVVAVLLAFTGALIVAYA